MIPKKSFTLQLAALALGALFSAGCGTSNAPRTASGAKDVRGWVSASKTQFLDGTGKPILLHGLNIINKSQAEGYTAGIVRTDFAAIHSWGMNCVRLGILWDGLEPEPGRIDEAYLERIARIVGWAKEEGLYVLLDMHQDLFSVKFSDGAPAWATLDDGKPYASTSVWSDAYYTSEAVQTALDHFWANHPGPDGLGLQDHYARVWRRVAERFRDEPAVLGFDLMNEPFPGRDAARLQEEIFTRLAELLRTKLGEKAPTAQKLMLMEGTPEGRKQVTAWLRDMELYRSILDAGTPILQAFERERLQPFYQRVRESIRQADTRHLLFLEPAMSSNIGIPSAIEPLVDEHGRRDPHQAYAPHSYDIVLDTPDAAQASNARIELIFSRHAAKARELHMPMVVGEWGAFYENPACVAAARLIVRQLDALRCGDMYWAYRRTLGQSPLLKALERRPTRAAKMKATHDRQPLYTYTLAHDGTPETYDESMAVACLQGIINRKAPEVYVHSRKNARPQYWLDLLSKDSCWLADRELKSLPDISPLVKQAGKRPNCAVIWDPTVPPSANVATTIAGWFRLDGLGPARQHWTKPASPRLERHASCGVDQRRQQVPRADGNRWHRRHCHQAARERSARLLLLPDRLDQPDGSSVDARHPPPRATHAGFRGAGRAYLFCAV